MAAEVDKEIFKIQMPLSPPQEGIPRVAFIYNRVRTIRTFVPLTEQLIRAMAGQEKKYVYGEIKNKEFVWLGEAPTQTW